MVSLQLTDTLGGSTHENASLKINWATATQILRLGVSAGGDPAASHDQIRSRANTEPPSAAILPPTGRETEGSTLDDRPHKYRFTHFSTRI